MDKFSNMDHEFEQNLQAITHNVWKNKHQNKWDNFRSQIDIGDNNEKKYANIEYFRNGQTFD